MSWGYVAVGGAMVIGGAMQADAAGKAAGAAGAAAGAQLGEARYVREEGRRIAESNMAEAMKFAEATPQEMMILDQSYQTADRALQREERLIAAIDPSIMEASKQALGILRGETARTNEPMMAMRKTQREKIVQQLREQYGPGAELSSLGQKSLQKFDLESDAMFAENQQSTLSQLFGIGTADVGGRLQRGVAGLQQVGQGYGALQERKLNTRMNMGNALLGAFTGTSQAVIQGAGAPYVGAAIAAQGQQAWGQQLTNIGGVGLGALLGRPAAEKKVPPNGTGNSAGGGYGSWGSLA